MAEKVKILSYHPFSIYATGGGSRILRRFYEDHEAEVTCLVLQESIAPIKRGAIEQVVISQFPLHRSWYRSRLRHLTTWLRNVAFKPLTINKIKAAENRVNYDIIHVVDHGALSSVLSDQIVKKNKELWASFHDYFSTSGSTFQNAKTLWSIAKRRFVISEEMGVKYCELFGKAPYEILTDGVYEHEISTPLNPLEKEEVISVYFAGLLHLDYLPLFRVLADSLDLLISEGYKIELILRGTQKVSFLNNRSFKTIYKPVSLNADELKAELDAAYILYLPIKFTDPLFHLYSLSTKMVGYLGAAGATLYHGPGDSAAAKVLTDGNAAICCYTFEKNDLYKSIKDLIKNNKEISLNAKVLAEEKFNLMKMKDLFWKF